MKARLLRWKNPLIAIESGSMVVFAAARISTLKTLPSFLYNVINLLWLYAAKMLWGCLEVAPHVGDTAVIMNANSLTF